MGENNNNINKTGNLKRDKAETFSFKIIIYWGTWVA